jgi:hypothetical protein
MPPRNCNRTKEKVAKQSKVIRLPIELEDYQEIIGDRKAFRKSIDGMIEQYPSLFPQAIVKGYVLHDMRTSVKMPEIQMRRIKLKERDEQGKEMVLTIVPSGIMPYLTGYTDKVEKALFLRRFGVPFWALSYVFGQDDDYWYRLASHLGSYSIVQTTVKDADRLPEHLLADEKHVHFNGEKGYIATTVAADCVLGASISLSADAESLTEAYGIFQEEAQALDPDYAPQTVNTDGWKATQLAWQTLFPLIVIMECFLHAFLKIRDRCQKRYQDVYSEISQRVWDVYHADTAALFAERIEHLSLWAQTAINGAALDAVEKLCAKAERFLLIFEHPEAYRTSNMIDRHMEPMDRWLFSARYFHGHLSSAERQVRAWALFHNFWPYCPRAKIRKHFLSPAHKFNGFVYHPNWLHNLLISTSGSGVS